jgi:hypothetical protein
MDMEIARLTNISWLRAPDPQAVAMRAAWMRPVRSWTQPGRRSTEDTLPVPMLDWPAALFQDEMLDH